MALSSSDLRLANINLDTIKTKKAIKFVAYIDETHYGCDYTIACGKVLWKLEAQTEEEALLELKKRIVPPLEDIDDGILELEAVTLYQIADEMSVPIDEWYEEWEQKEENQKIDQERKKEHLEYKRLKKKFE